LRNVLLKRSVRNILRIPARSILLGLLIFVVSFLTMMGFAIESGTKTSIMNIRRSLSNDVRLSVNFRELMRRYQLISRRMLKSLELTQQSIC